MVGDSAEGRFYSAVGWCLEEEGFNERIQLTDLPTDPEPRFVVEMLVDGFYARDSVQGDVFGTVETSGD